MKERESYGRSRRFGIVQSGKARNIDDLSEFSVNLAYGGEVVGFEAQWAKACGGGGRVYVLFSDGTQLQGQMRQDFCVEGAT